MSHEEHHRIHRTGWLRAAVLGANDGIVSTSSLIIGMLSAQANHETVVVAGLAGLIAGAVSMAAGEYVSVCSQADIEKSDLEQERRAIEEDFKLEQQELSEIYQQRGLDKDLAEQVAKKLMEVDPLKAHARDEIGIHEENRARPVQAAISSSLSFAIGALLPLLTVFFVSEKQSVVLVASGSLLFLGLLGAISSRLSGTKIIVGVTRIIFWGVLAMLCTALVGRLFSI